MSGPLLYLKICLPLFDRENRETHNFMQAFMQHIFLNYGNNFKRFVIVQYSNVSKWLVSNITFSPTLLFYFLLRPH